jgi:hypothetical protein
MINHLSGVLLSHPKGALQSVEAAKRRKIIIGVPAGCFVELPKM